MRQWLAYKLFIKTDNVQQSWVTGTNMDPGDTDQVYTYAQLS
jgi:hypothetical protein